MDTKSLEQSTESSISEDSKIVKIIKFLTVIALAPMVGGLVKGLISELAKHGDYAGTIAWGVGTYVTIHLFVYEPLEFYKGTQKFIQFVFGVFSPIFRVSYYILPFWAVAVLIGYAVCVRWLNYAYLMPMFYFMTGFFFAMHVVMVARILKTDELRQLFDYLFVIFIVLIMNILFFAINVWIYDPSFSISAVITDGWQFTGAAFAWVVHKIASIRQS
jgi:hypothetical protein